MIGGRDLQDRKQTGQQDTGQTAQQERRQIGLQDGGNNYVDLKDSRQTEPDLQDRGQTG